MNKPYDWYPVPVYKAELKREIRIIDVVRLLRRFRRRQLVDLDQLKKVGGL